METEKTDKPDEAVEQQGRPASAATETTRSWFARGSSLLSIIAAVLGLVVGIYSTFSSYVSVRMDVVNESIKKELALKNLVAIQEDRLQPIIDRIKNLEQHISSLANIPKEDALYIELQKMAYIRRSGGATCCD